MISPRSTLRSLLTEASLLPGCGLLLLGLACGPPPVSSALSCVETFGPGGGRGLERVLEKAAPGDCVVLGNRTYRGNFLLPAGVQLVAGTDRLPRLETREPGQPTLSVRGGEGTLVAGLEIVGDGAQGLDVRDAPARLEGLTVSSPDDIAAYLGCPTAGCQSSEAITLVDCVFRDAEVGLWVDGVHAITSGSTFEDTSGSGAVEGYGALVSGGGRLESEGDRMARNGGIGLLADGAETSVQLRDVEVVDNLGPGVWVQGLRGSAARPALRLDGSASTLSTNSKAGFGSVDSVGIVMDTCIVRDTLPVPWPVGAGTVFQVGDGVALLSGSSDIQIGAGVTLSGNDRGQLIVDQGGTSIVMDTATVEPGQGRYGVVIQNTTNPVGLPTGVVPDTVNGVLGVDDGIRFTP